MTQLQELCLHVGLWSEAWCWHVGGVGRGEGGCSARRGGQSTRTGRCAIRRTGRAGRPSRTRRHLRRASAAEPAEAANHLFYRTNIINIKVCYMFAHQHSCQNVNHP